MVGALAGDVGDAHAVLQHFHPRALQPPDDRPADAGAEVGVGYARQSVQHLAQRPCLAQFERVAGQHVDRLDQFVGAAVAARVGRDDHRRQRRVAARTGLFVGVDGSDVEQRGKRCHAA